MKIWWVYLDAGTGNYVHYNHGVGQLDACLRRAGHTSELLYLRHHLARDEFLARLRAAAPDAVFFPVNTHQWVDAPRYARWVKEATDLPCVFGGIHAILDPESVIGEPFADVVCIGEGEAAVVEWCAAREAGRPAGGIGNLWQRRPDGTVERNPRRPLVADLDALPIDDRAMWDHDEILRDALGEIGIMGGRGCPFDCAYCANSARREAYRGLGPYVRMCRPEKMIALVAHLAAHLPFRKIFFEDDIFTLDHDWVRRFCALYRERFSYPFKIYIHVQTVTREILQTLKDAGCYMVMAGVEAGNERLRAEVLNRRMSNDDLRRVFRWCDEIGLQTWTFNMVGFPGETEETIRDLFALHRELRPNGAQCSIFYPYPGTRLHRRCVAENLIDQPGRPTYFEKSILKPGAVGRERLEEVFWEFRRETLRLKAEKERLGSYDLLAELPAARVGRELAHEPVRLNLVKIDGDERLCLFAHPRSRVVWRVFVPAGARFSAAIALDPLCLGWGGKGVRFQVEIDGHECFARYLDPKANPEENRWHEVAVDLTEYAGRTVSLALSTDPHPSGDLVGAWGVWAKPRVD
ncbi:MAG: radical SAM protein [Myxococcales bacterium]|nr:radical SAM protein [Myxococcales bacterium]